MSHYKVLGEEKKTFDGKKKFFGEKKSLLVATVTAVTTMTTDPQVGKYRVFR